MTKGSSTSGSSARALVDEVPEATEELVEPGTRDRRQRDRVGIVQLRRGDVGLASDHEPWPFEQLRPVLLQLVEQDPLLLFGRALLDAGEVEQQHEHARAFDVPEERVAEPASLRRAFDEAGDVGEHELVVAEAHDTEVRFERGERIVGDLGLRRAHRRDQRGLPRVGEADERGVGDAA